MKTGNTQSPSRQPAATPGGPGRLSKYIVAGVLTALILAVFLAGQLQAPPTAEAQVVPTRQQVTGFTLDSANNNPKGIWGNDETFWISQNGSPDKLFAYNRSDGSPDSSQDFGILTGVGNAAPTGICSDGTTMFVADFADTKVYAYNLATKARDSAKEFNLASANAAPEGLWCDATHVWVVNDANSLSSKIFAYQRSDGSHVSSMDFDASTLSPSTTDGTINNSDPRDAWANGTTLFTVDDEDQKVYAYKMSDQSIDSDKNITLDTNNDDPEGLWFDGRVLWVVDRGDDYVYAYDLPGAQPDNTPAEGAPGVRTGTDQSVWTATITPGYSVNSVGYLAELDPTVGSITSNTFDVDGDTFTVINLYDASIHANDGPLILNIDKQPPGEFTVTVDGESFSSTEAFFGVLELPTEYIYTWDANPSWSASDTIAVSISVDEAPQQGVPATASTIRITDDDDVENNAFLYQWIRIDGTTETLIDDATDRTYTPTAADVSKNLKVRVVFNDDAGNQEYPLSSRTIGPVLPNTAATGAPTISGTEQAGELLSTATSAIQDAEGLTNVSYTYQWLRNDGTNDIEIPGAVGPQYIPSDADVSNTIKVRVNFTDDANKSEQLTSIATATVTAAASGSIVWSATLKVGDLGDLGVVLGYLPEGTANLEHDGALTPPNFTRNGTLYTFLRATLSDVPGDPTNLKISPNLTRNDMESWTIIFREKEFRLSDSLRVTQNQASGFDEFSIHRSGLSWTNDEYVAVALNIGSVVNNPRLDLVLDNVSQGGRFITVKPHSTNTSDFGYGPDYDYTGSSISAGNTFFTGQTHEDTGTNYGYTYEYIAVTSTGDLQLRLSVNAPEGSTVPIPTTSHLKLNLDGEAFDLGEATVTQASVTDHNTHLLFVWPSSSLTWIDDQQVVVFVQADELPVDPTSTETMTGGICSRSQAIQDAIMQRLGDEDSCSDVTLDHVRDLTTLHIYSRELQTLKASDLDGFISLETLSISGANLQSIESGAFAPVNHSLRHVHFAHNDLQISDLSGLTSNLTSLSLAHNNISSLGANAFSRFTKLEQLNLEGNPITSLHADAFDGLTSLIGLYLGGYNPPYSWGTGKRRLILNADQFAENRSLQILNVSNSRIGTIPVNTFNNLGSLQALVLKDNNLTSITPDTFHADLGALRSLSLGCNRLTTASFSNNWTAGVDSLRDLYLHNNYLTEINARVLSTSRLPRMKFLSLENNPNLEIFNASVLQGHSRRLDILMFGNEWMELWFVGGPPSGWPSNVHADFHSDVRSCGDYNVAEPTFRVGDAVASESGNGADSTMTFSVNLQYGDADPHSVEYHTQDGTATAGSDYTAVSGTLTFAPDEYSKTVLITVKDDNFEDSGETFQLVLSNPTGGSHIHGTAGTATGTILNHDQPGVEASFPQSPQTSTLHTGAADQPQVIVAFSAAVNTFGTHTPSVQVTGGSLTSVTAQDLDEIDNAWLFVLAPSGDSNVTLELIPNQACANGGICTADGTPVTAVPATLTIPGPDQAPTTAPLTARFANVPPDHDGSSFTFQLYFSENVNAGYAKIGDDAFTITGGDVANASRITQGSNQGWNVTVDPDDNGPVSITLPETTNCTATGAICTHDDRKLSQQTSATVAGPPAISVSDATVQEADDAVLAFTVTLSHASSRTVTVAYATQGGSATAGSDYTAASGTLTFNAGNTSDTIRVPVLTDSDDESQETLTITLSNPVSATLADATGTGTIENGDSSSSTVVNSPPNGLPTISGNPQVDQTLTADTSPIADEDGLDHVFLPLPVDRRGVGHRRSHRLQLPAYVQRAGADHPGAGDLHRRPEQRRDPDQRGDCRSDGGPHSPHGQLPGRALVPRRGQFLHLRAALQ